MNDKTESYAGDLDQPTDLSPLGLAAYHALESYIREKGLLTGGCKAFYSPSEWEDREGFWGIHSELIIVFDGGDLGRLGWDSEVQSTLADLGLYIEDCTCWYAAVYPI